MVSKHVWGCGWGFVHGGLFAEWGWKTLGLMLFDWHGVMGVCGFFYC